MKHTLLFIAILATGCEVKAECYMQSDSMGRTAGRLEQVADVKRYVVSYIDNQKKCIVSFRAFTKNQWWHGSGENVFKTSISEDQACNVALEVGKNQLAAQIYGQTVVSEGHLICSDLPKVTTRKVTKIGDVIQISEVQPHPNKKEPFGYKNTECRFFIETDVGSQGTRDLYTWQGVICNVRHGDWQVIDKW